MTSFALRCLALATMVVDHAGYMLFPQLGWMRMVGRIAFPLFCFLLAQGFRHTRSLPKYALRLALFALLSEGVYNLVFSGRFTVLSAHNVFYALLLALGALVAWKHFLPRWPLGALLGPLAACVLAVALQTDYGFWGVLLCLCFYLAGDGKPNLALALVASLGVFTLYRFVTRAASATWIWTQWYCLASLPILLLYNGKPGFRGGKWAFYALYPAHLLVLWLIKNNLF
ncbi:MAG: conjugal transfer protein TraX [Clostridia bacterium]|nr:conjugal transfer protein TraX [Clostridia bacterium]